MKSRFVVAIFLIIAFTLCLAVSGPASQKIAGQATSQMSTVVSATGQAVSGPAVYHGIVVMTDGANALTVQVYNGTSAAGSAIYPAAIVVPVSFTTGNPLMTGFTPPIACPNGIYVTVSQGAGTGVLKINYDQ